jgi:hypothetical protein
LTQAALSSSVGRKLLESVSVCRLLIVAMGLIVATNILLAVTVSPLAGIGMLGAVALAAVSPERQGLASGINNINQLPLMVLPRHSGQAF